MKVKAPRTRQKLSTQQQKFVKHFTDPKSPTHLNIRQSRYAAGYSRKHYGDEIPAGTRDFLLAAIKKAGLTEELIAAKLSEGLQATTKFRAINRKTGQVIYEAEDPDFTNRHKHLQTLLELRNDFPQKEPTEQTALILRIPERPLSFEEWSSLYGKKAPKLLSEADYVDTQVLDAPAVPYDSEEAPK